MSDPGKIAVGLLTKPTARDQQVKIGASNASTPCARCLAEDLARSGKVGHDTYVGLKPQKRSVYIMGAIIGTAIHERLQTLIEDQHPDWMPEQRVIVGHLEGYGDVKSTTDLYTPHNHQVIDWKTTTSKKLPALKEALTTEGTKWDKTSTAEARFKTTAYLAQLHLYGRGIINAGYEVDSVGIGFICRDARTEKDVWGFDTPYDPEYTERVWTRLERIWAAVQDGRPLEEFPSHQHCWTCNVMRDND